MFNLYLPGRCIHTINYKFDLSKILKFFSILNYFIDLIYNFNYYCNIKKKLKGDDYEKFWIGAGSGFLFLIIILSAYFFSGVFNISTAAKHPLIDGIMGTISNRSVDFHSGKKLNITKSNADIKKGASDYMETCVMCHGAPGYEKNNFAKYMIRLPLIST